MKMVKILLFSSTLFFFISGCAQKSSSDINLDVSVATISHISSIAGGIFLMIQGTDGSTQYFDLPDSHQLSLPTGIFNIYLIAYLGPSAWQGQTYCGDLANTNIQGAELTLQINLSSAHCATKNDFYKMDLIKNPTSNWDVAQWDGVNWGP